ncbi:MAG: hypothetical protein ACRD0J_08620 [Acidimicrobiales bacterium]
MTAVDDPLGPGAVVRVRRGGRATGTVTWRDGGVLTVLWTATLRKEQVAVEDVRLEVSSPTSTSWGARPATRD